MSSYRLEEGRLAVLVGDRDGAVLAYTHFLALRRGSESPAVSEARRQLDALGAAAR